MSVVGIVFLFLFTAYISVALYDRSELKKHVKILEAENQRLEYVIEQQPAMMALPEKGDLELRFDAVENAYKAGVAAGQNVPPVVPTRANQQGRVEYVIDEVMLDSIREQCKADGYHRALMDFRNGKVR